MPEIDCTSSIYYGVSFQLYVPSHLLSDYKSHEKLQYLAEQIHSLSFSSDSNSYTTNDDYYPSNGSYENQDMNNGFGWNRLPKSFMAQNTVFLLMTAPSETSTKLLCRD